MSSPFQKGGAALKSEEGKLKKVFAAIKNFFAKEFLWLLFILILAIPIAFITEYIFNNYAPKSADIKQNLNGQSIFVAAYIVSIAGCYFTRIIVGAIQTLASKTD